MPLLCVGPSVRKFHRYVKIVDMSDERTALSMRTTLFLRILVRFLHCHPSPGTVTGFRTKKAGQQTSTPHPCTLD